MELTVRRLGLGSQVCAEQAVAPSHAPLLPAPTPQIAMKEKNAAEERMAVVQAKLDEMQAQFDAAMAQKQVGAVGQSGLLPRLQGAEFAACAASRAHA